MCIYIRLCITPSSDLLFFSFFFSLVFLFFIYFVFLLDTIFLQISPKEGLDVKLSGSGAKGSPPTTLSPTMITVDWRCKYFHDSCDKFGFVLRCSYWCSSITSILGEKARDTPYEVEITIPVENYAPVQFTFAKICGEHENFNIQHSLVSTMYWHHIYTCSRMIANQNMFLACFRHLLIALSLSLAPF